VGCWGTSIGGKKVAKHNTQHRRKFVWGLETFEIKMKKMFLEEEKDSCKETGGKQEETRNK